jgi:hypothetical protein
MKIGRNDPCPCGSGKKYKKCCMGKTGSQPTTPATIQSQVPVTQSSENEVYNGLFAKLMKFAQRQENEKEFDGAFAEFFMKPDYEDYEKDYGAHVFWGWLLIYRRVRGLPTMAERYLERFGSKLAPLERKMLETIGDEPFRLFEIRDIRLDQGMTLKDLFTEEVFEVKERLATRSLHKWELIFARLRRFRNYNGLDIIVPAARNSRERLMAGLDLFLIDLRKEVPEATMADVMKRELPDVFDFIVDVNRDASRPPKLTTFDGEDLIFCEARFQCKDEDAVRQILDRHRSFHPMQEDEDGDYRWVSGVRKETSIGGPGQISLGYVTFDKGMLILETKSRERLKKGKALLEKNAGEYLVHRADSFQDPDQAIAATKSRPKPEPASLPSEVEQQILKEHYERYYLEQWPQMPIPALGGKTPLEAAEDETLRPRLIELLKDFELSMQRDSKNTFYIQRLWKKLKLEG